MNHKQFIYVHRKSIIAIIALIAIGVMIIVWRGSRTDDSDWDLSETSASQPSRSSEISAGINGIRKYDYKDALNHIGEKAKVSGTVLKVFTSKSGVTFLDFCESVSDCPFSAVIFASDLEKFGDVSQYERPVVISGIIKSYKGSAEIILNSPDQIE